MTEDLLNKSQSETLFRYTKVLGLSALAIMYLLQIEFNIPGLSTTALFFFGLGAFLGLFKYNMLIFVISYGKLSGIISLIALAIIVYYTARPENELWVRIFVVSGLVTTLYLGFLITKYNSLKERLLVLAKPVFFIYALHLIYILGWFKGALAKSPLADSGCGMMLGYFIVPFLCIAVILFIYEALKRFFPRIMGCLTGNRVKLT